MFKNIVSSALKHVVAFTLLMAVSLSFAQAQAVDPERLAAAKELMTSMNLDKMYASMVPMMFEQIKAQEVSRNPAQKEELDQVFAAMTEIFQGRTVEMIDKIGVLYAKSFTTEEMKELTKFYSSPVGQKILEKMPALTTEAMQLGQEWGTSLLPEIMKKKEELMQKKAK